RHTRCSRDWSSDVCSSDLFILMESEPSNKFPPTASSTRKKILAFSTPTPAGTDVLKENCDAKFSLPVAPIFGVLLIVPVLETERSEERRVGREGVSGARRD